MLEGFGRITKLELNPLYKHNHPRRQQIIIEYLIYYDIFNLIYFLRFGLLILGHVIRYINQDCILSCNQYICCTNMLYE
jgi:hypothetical protein